MIWERVAQVLLSKGRISRSQLVEARRTQGFFGGRLVGHLLRLGYVDESSLGDALTEVFGVPFADASRFHALQDEVRAALPESLVERHRVFPLHLAGDHLAVAMADPRERLAIKEMETASGRTVDPRIATEQRLDLDHGRRRTRPRVGTTLFRACTPEGVARRGGPSIEDHLCSI